MLARGVAPLSRASGTTTGLATPASQHGFAALQDTEGRRPLGDAEPPIEGAVRASVLRRCARAELLIGAAVTPVRAEGAVGVEDIEA